MTEGTALVPRNRKNRAGQGSICQKHQNSSRLIAGSFHFLFYSQQYPPRPLFSLLFISEFPCGYACVFLHVRYNSHVKYFEVFEICFINSDIRKYFMEIRNLITFTKVAETQSLSKAAKALGYAQSTVTMQMQQLEQELGTQLYERVGKQIRITQTGQEFLSYAGSHRPYVGRSPDGWQTEGRRCKRFSASWHIKPAVPGCWQRHCAATCKAIPRLTWRCRPYRIRTICFPVCGITRLTSP